MTSNNLPLKEILRFLEKDNYLLADELYDILNSILAENLSNAQLILSLEKFNKSIDTEFDKLRIDRSKNRDKMHLYLSIQFSIDHYIKNLTSSNSENTASEETIEEKMTNIFAPFLLVTLDKNFEFNSKNHKPIGFFFKEYFSITSFKELLIETYSILYKNNPILFKSIINDKDIERYFSYNKSSLRCPENIYRGSGIYVETNQSANSLMNLLKKCFIKYNINPLEFKILLCEKNKKKIIEPDDEVMVSTINEDNEDNTAQSTLLTNVNTSTDIIADIDKTREKIDCIYYCQEKDYCIKINNFGCYTYKTCFNFTRKIDMMRQTNSNIEVSNNKPNNETKELIQPLNKEKTKPIIYVSKQIKICPYCNKKLNSKVQSVTFIKDGIYQNKKLLSYICTSCDKQYINNTLFETFTKNKDCSTMNIIFKKIHINSQSELTQKPLIKSTNNSIPVLNTPNTISVTDFQIFVNGKNRILKELKANESLYASDDHSNNYLDKEPILFYIYDNNIFKNISCDEWNNQSYSRWTELLYRIIIYFHNKVPNLFKNLPSKTSMIEDGVTKFKISFDPKVLEKPILLCFKINHKPVFLETQLSPNMTLNTIYSILDNYNFPKEYLLIILKKKLKNQPQY